MSNLGVALGLLLALAGCARSRTLEAPTPQAPDPGPEITAMLRASAESWNQGDIEGFLDDYLDSPQTAFVGGSGVIRGLDEIRRRYRAGYWSTGRPRDLLRFEDLEVQRLGAEHALAIGRYILSDPATDQTTGHGVFSLVLVRTPQGWRIIHDHSSAAN